MFPHYRPKLYNRDSSALDKRFTYNDVSFSFDFHLICVEKFVCTTKIFCRNNVEYK